MMVPTKNHGTKNFQAKKAYTNQLFTSNVNDIKVTLLVEDSQPDQIYQ